MAKERKVDMISKKYRKRSRAGEIWHRLKKNKGAMAGLLIICLLALTALSVDMIFDYDT